MEEIRSVMDNLFQRKIKFEDAVAILGISENELHKMIGSYEYILTKEQIRKVNKMIIETIEYVEKDMPIIYDRIKRQDIKSPNAVSENPIILSSSEEVIKEPITPSTDGMNIPYNPLSHGYIG